MCANAGEESSEIVGGSVEGILVVWGIVIVGGSVDDEGIIVEDIVVLMVVGGIVVAVDELEAAFIVSCAGWSA
jgi:hypothetical protein